MDNINTIEHTGIVRSIGDKYASIAILSHPSCTGCAASGVCDVSGKSEKLIHAGRNIDLSPGDRVIVVMEQSLGYRALLLGYILPFIIVLIMIIILTSLSVHELLAGLISIGSMAVYYLVIYLNKEKIGRKFSFTIKKQI
ncbi:MAG: SoxR reducing system RseC family protein [Bacteroidales bacterium]|nr:SoxR reducing system RseC family protein [Bacteroidales bacterium]